MKKRNPVPLMILLWIAIVIAYAAVSAKGAELDDLRVARPNRCSPYDPDDYDGYRSGYAKRKARLAPHGWIDAYTLSEYVDGSDLDVDHVVPRFSAHVSGLCKADRETRERFSRDERNMALTHWYINRIVKGAKDAGEWLPPKEKCAYASTVVDIRAEYGLTITKDARRALRKALGTCDE